MGEAMKNERNESYTVTGITHKGEGIVRMEGKVCFVPGALPGETVQVEKTLDKRKFSRGRLTKIIQPSPERRESVCPNYAECGGCVWQHTTYEQQLLFKREIIRQQLKRLAGIECEVREVLGMETPYHYRNKVVWHGAKKPDGSFKLGFFQEGSHNAASMEGCILPPPKMLEIGKRIEEKAAEYGIKPGDEIILRQSNVDGSFLLAVKGNPDAAHIAELSVQFPELTSICRIEKGKTIPIVGEPYQLQRLAGCVFSVSAQSFFQTNFSQTEKLYQEVRKNLSGDEKKRVLDAYCGSGTISCMLAKEGHEVLGIESNPFAVADAKRNAEKNGVSPTFLCAPCEEEMKKLHTHFDAVVIDPPRAGCFAGTLEALLTIKPEKIIYVSCEPSTLARDVKILTAGGYEVSYVQPVDLFPWTGSLEVVVLLSKGEIDSKKIRVEFPLDDMEITAFREKATYPQIKEYVMEQTGLKVSSLYISQIKRKCGLDVGDSYNKPKSENAKVPQCPPEKEKAIMDALRHFGMIS